jgi:hypothetical protein
MDSEARGGFIAQNSYLKSIHNSHVCEEIECIKNLLQKNSGNSEAGDAFHYSALIPYNQTSGLLELDGLQKDSILLEKSKIFWLILAKQYLKYRMAEIQKSGNLQDIRFCLIAISPIHRNSSKKNCLYLEDSCSEKLDHSYNYIPDLLQVLEEISICKNSGLLFV